jgi:tetrahydromethanopterin S-methyltransferase subunit G
MEMDPTAPVRYKSHAVLPQGVGMAIYQTMRKEKSIQDFAEMLSNRTLFHWLNTPGNDPPWRPELERKFNISNQLIHQSSIGRGPERCLYELNDNIPCLSPLLEKHYVCEPDELLLSLDELCKTDDKSPDQLIDRHIAGFISARDDRDYAGVMAKISDEDAGQRRLAELTILSILQKRYLKDNQLPNLLKWMQPHAQTICNRFRNKERRARIIREIPEAVNSGDLGKLMGVVDNAAEVQNDIAEFRQAQSDYQHMANRLDELENRLANDDTAGQSTGRELAVVISGVCAGLIMIATLITHLAELKDSFIAG